MPDQPAPTTHRPILIVGANGSGTTLLRLMLDSHPHLAIPPETGFLRLAMAHQWVPYWPLGEGWHTRLGLSDDDLTTALATFYGNMFASYAETRGKQRWGDKTPFHLWHLRLAAQMYPELQVIGIARHPGAVVSSLRRRFRRPVPRATRHWLRSTRQMVRAGSELGDRFALLRYEDLVLSPEPTMRALLDWLGEPWSDRVLAHHEREPDEAEGFTRTDTPLTAEHIGDWERSLRGNALRRVTTRTSDIARFLGYDPHRSVPVEAFPHALLTGTELAERRRTTGAPIDWDKGSRPRAEDRPLRPPPPRKRRRRADVPVGKALRQRANDLAREKLPESTRKRAHEIRRNRPGLDRFLGPR